MPREVPSLEQIRGNPTLHPLAFKLVNERFPDLKWHSHADDPKSSQAFAVSAFVPLLTFADKDATLERFVTDHLLSVPHKMGREWDIIPEFTKPELLGETGAGIPTNVDVLLVADDAVVCVESKFVVDAEEGFGRCGQFTSGACLGYHGSGSDAKGSSAPCRLGVRDGRRNPRYYWQLGHNHFRDEVFAEQQPSGVCPYRDTYQLMRNYLLASEFARNSGRGYFGVIGIVPSARSSAIRGGVRRFSDEVLLPANKTRVAAAAYEDYIAVLERGSPEARDLAVFLRALL